MDSGDRGRGRKREGTRRGKEEKSKKRKGLVRLAVKSFLPEEYLCGHIGCNARCTSRRELQLHMSKNHRAPKHCKHCSIFCSTSKRELYKHTKECNFNPEVFTNRNLQKKQAKATSTPHTISQAPKEEAARPRIGSSKNFVEFLD